MLNIHVLQSNSVKVTNNSGGGKEQTNTRSLINFDSDCAGQSGNHVMTPAMTQLGNEIEFWHRQRSRENKEWFGNENIKLRFTSSEMKCLLHRESIKGWEGHNSQLDS